ncbi:hypothetical protein GCM10007036_24940 [Alsobacter metallidurans]|uniref:Uncharacterized protein n=1 Tax=Alsobacter metallidurans TaxID=340221 RepID=A0A917MIK1_9HYPH|nr:hypothetical protein GCM10007036_24940 [Alsobacter metallidurans]
MWEIRFREHDSVTHRIYALRGRFVGGRDDDAVMAAVPLGGASHIDGRVSHSAPDLILIP